MRAPLLLLALALLSAPAFAEPLAKDRAALAACLAKAGDKGESCIGVIRDPCLNTQEGSSTAGTVACSGREIEAWDERLNAAYRKALASEIGTQATQRAEPSGAVKSLTGADILRDAQRSWIAYRDKKCDAAGLPMEGGSGAQILRGDCTLVETARQALWLDALTAQR